MNYSHLIFELALQHVPKIGDITAKRLIAHCGNAELVFKEKKQNLLKIDGIGTNTISALFNGNHLEAAEKELKYINDNNITVCYFEDNNYPEHLKQCIDAPILIFQTGQINVQKQRIISIVGTRKITTQGIAFCEHLVATLAVYNPIIVSGFAYGTDITAHKSALKHNLQTIACLAHGLNQIYPAAHKKYMVEVEKKGGFITDFWSTSTFDRNNFLKRNRIIAGLSQATIVIESAEKGGGLVTADMANSYHREVFAVPGRTNDAYSTGCNNLIKHQNAYMLTTPLDVPYLLNWELEHKKPSVTQKKLFVDLDETETKIVNYLKTETKEQLDIIALNCDIPVYKLAGILINLEMKGVIRPLPGKLFELL